MAVAILPYFLGVRVRDMGMNIAEKRIGASVEYMVGSPYAVLTRFQIKKVEPISDIDVLIYVDLIKMQKNYENEGFQRGQRVSVLLDYSCLKKGYVDFAMAEKTPFVEGLQQSDFRVCINRTDTLGLAVLKHLKEHHVVSNTDDGTLEPEREYLLSVVDKEFNKENHKFTECYKGLDELILLWLQNGKVYTKSLNAFLDRKKWVIKERLKGIEGLQSEFSIRIDDDCTIYGCNKTNEIKSALIEQTTINDYNFSYWTEDNPYFTAWICSKINGRSTEGIERRIMNKLSPNCVFTVGSEAKGDVSEYIEKEFDVDLGAGVGILVEFDGNREDYFVASKINLGYEDIKRKIREGRLLKIDKGMIAECLRKLAKFKMMGETNIIVYFAVDDDLEVKSYRISKNALK